MNAKNYNINEALELMRAGNEMHNDWGYYHYDASKNIIVGVDWNLVHDNVVTTNYTIDEFLNCADFNCNWTIRS